MSEKRRASVRSSLAEGIERSVCISKATYETVEQAREFAAGLKDRSGKNQKAYRCKICRGIHLYSPPSGAQRRKRKKVGQ